MARIIEGALEPGQPKGRTRVTLVRPDNTIGLLSFAEAFYRELRFNGQSAVENGDSYREITYPAGALSVEAIAALVARIVATSPTYLVMLDNSGGSNSLAIMEGVEVRSSGHAPTYLIPGSLEGYARFMGYSAERRRRLFEVMSTSNSVANARFVIRYNAATGDHVDRGFNPAVSYDAFYLLAYAAFALGREPVTGRSLASAIGRLVPPGPQIEVGPTHVYEALGLLSHGGRIDLQGASTALDFDLATGELSADFALGCSRVDTDGRATGEYLESGVVVDSKTKRVEGTINCP
jgi:hypothetical protein